jgi:excisionase family DNA binding protein
MTEPSEQKKPLAISLDEVASSVGVEVMTIRREVQRGHLRATRVGRRLVVMQADWIAYLNRNIVREKKVKKP